MLALVGVFLSMLIKEHNRSVSVLLSAACGVIILISVVGDVADIVSFSESFTSEMTFGSDAFALLLKATGLAYLVDFSADICRDAGENGTAKKLEIAGKITIMAMALPVFASLFEKIRDVFI